MDRFLRLLASPDGRLHLLSGEPGIGKTRLLEEMNRALTARGWIRLRGRAFEAERGRAFGPWMDAARALAAERPGAAANCPLLRPAAMPESVQSDAYALFEAVREWLVSLSGPDTEGNTAPVALIFDDIHWLDPISAALLQYLLRAPDRPFRLMLGGIRSVGAAPDASVEALLRLAQREGWSETWNIGPLDAKDTASLVKALGSRRDPAEVFSRSAGHPLAAVAYALEGGAEGSGALVSLETMLDERISLTGYDGRQVLQWSALIGRGLPPALLESLLDLPLHALLSSLERLEAHGLVRVEESEAGMEYLFGHDLIRRRVQDSISAPRRARMHAHVALTLRRHPSLSRGPEETAHHAELGEQWELAADACLHAAQHCLRLRAFDAVEKLVERGLDHCARLGGHWALRHDFSFLANQILFFLGQFPSGLESRLQDLIQEAKSKGQEETAMAALFALAAMRFVQEQPAGMLAAAEQMEFGGEVVNPAGRADSLAGMALCLLVTDLDIPRANRLIEESKRIDAEHAVGMPKILMAAEGWLAWREGRLADARTHLIHARARMNASDLPQSEQRILGVLAQVELEDGNPLKAMEYAGEMEAFSNLLRYLPDRHFPGAITAMAKTVLGDSGAEGSMRESLELLRAENCKAMTAYLLLFHSELDLRAGRRLADIPARCVEAIERCLPLGRTREPAWARCLLGLTALRQGDRNEARRHWDALDVELKSTTPLPGRVAKLADELAAGLGL